MLSIMLPPSIAKYAPSVDVSAAASAQTPDEETAAAAEKGSTAPQVRKVREDLQMTQSVPNPDQLREQLELPLGDARPLQLKLALDYGVAEFVYDLLLLAARCEFLRTLLRLAGQPVVPGELTVTPEQYALARQLARRPEYADDFASFGGGERVTFRTYALRVSRS
jgi:hypothetical protein